MATVNEIPRINRWLSTVLRADPTLVAAASGGVYRGHIPAGRSYPVVLIEYIAPLDDTDGNAGFRVWTRLRYLVRGIVESNTDASVQTIADRIDAVLHAVQGGVSDVGIAYCKRVKPYYQEMQGVDSKRTYIHSGGEFEIAAYYTG